MTKKFNLVWIIGVAVVAFASGLCCGVVGKDKSSENIKIDETASSDTAIVSEKPTTDEPVNVDSTVGLNIYYPNYSRIDLVCGEMPEKSNDSILFMASAAYTSKALKEFSHSNIVGPHVSGGVFYVPNGHPKGAFSYYDNKPHFTYGDYDSQMRLAAQKGGCAFSQDMMICNGELTEYDRDPNKSTYYRALCLIDDKLAIVDSKGMDSFELFVDRLQHLNVSDAIYMDMGGWSYSWYRDGKNEIVELGNPPTEYATNWLVFYK